MSSAIRFKLNGRAVSVDADGDRTLLSVLRSDLDLTGTKYGCGSGFCGSCTVVVDGRAVRSCQTRMATVEGKNVVTIEGLAKGETLHPLQRAFIDHGALQCGYCTSGMLMNAYALLLRNPKPTRSEIIEGMDRNLCRCGAHQRIIAAIEDASGAKGGLS